MKIKIDYVTNSSSSSFVVMGAIIKLDSIPSAVIEMAAKNYDMEEHDLDDVNVVMALFELLIDDSDLEYSYGPDDYYAEMPAVGMSYEAMREDDTLREFKGNIQNKIFEVLAVNTHVSHIQMCWEDN